MDCCWMWWYSEATRDGFHRCAEPDRHGGVHRCCCGAISEYASRTAVGHPGE
jgi:hypothetical protein